MPLKKCIYIYIFQKWRETNTRPIIHDDSLRASFHFLPWMVQEAQKYDNELKMNMPTTKFEKFRYIQSGVKPCRI